MRRLFLPLSLLASLAVAMPTATAGEAPASADAGAPHDHSTHAHTVDAPVPPDRPRAGLVYQGLRPAEPGGPCDAGDGADGLYEIRHGGRSVGCTHGPDPAPAGVDVRDVESAADGDSNVEAASAGEIACVGDGVSGYRTQAIYAYRASAPSRFKTYAPLIRGWAADVVDAVFDGSAAKTGGDRHVRFVTDADTCRLDIDVVPMPGTAVDTFGGTIDYLEGNGYAAPNRKYLVWMDANVYCGIAELYGDDRDIVGNYNNGPSFIPGMIARVDAGCWGRTGSTQTPVEAHELMHNLGGVQDSAPHTTYLAPGTGGHCTDDYDVMCYDDDGIGPVTTTVVCTQSSHERLFDCGNDDYFHTSPPAGSYLDTHWNTADSRFLERTDVPPPTMAAPANDAFGSARSLSGASVSATGSNVGASKEAGEPNHAGNAGGASIWFRWTAPESGTVDASTSGSAVDSLLGVYTGTDVGGLVQVASNDDRSAADLTSGASFPVTAGTTYSFAVDGYGGDVGPVSFTVGYRTVVSERSAGLSANRRRVRAGSRAVLTANVSGCAGGDAVRLRRGTKSWTKTLDGSCAVSFRVKITRTSRFRAVDLASGAVSPTVKIRVKR